MSVCISSKENKCSFDCPITGEKEQVSICAFKRNRVYRGKSSGLPVCTCAIHSGKCVIVKVMQSPSQNLQDHFVSTTEKKVEVPKAVMETIQAIIVPPSVLAHYGTLDDKDMERLSSVVPRDSKKAK